MPDPSPTQALAFSGPLVQAQLAWSALKGHGIEALLFENHASLVSVVGNADVVVRPEDLERALALLVEMELIEPSEDEAAEPEA